VPQRPHGRAPIIEEGLAPDAPACQREAFDMMIVLFRAAAGGEVPASLDGCAWWADVEPVEIARTDDQTPPAPA